ncbi:MAG: phenylacetate--CoA ligase family protein [Stellaceae bacterium]|jgi:phenylacetate-coenzyme A ligase PaaK-like adenylate-forming protein
MAAQFYDTLETRDPAEREAAMMGALPQIIAAAKERSPAYRRLLTSVHPKDIIDRRSLAELPLTRKSSLIELQRQDPPFGGFVAAPLSELRRVFVSPGPIYEPEGRRSDYWRFARALFAAGFRAGDLVHNTFSYHLTPAGAMAESGADALGCPVIPAGTGQTEQQLRTIADLKPVAYVGTPSFLKVLLDRAAAEGSDISSLRKALVGAEALPSALRAEFRNRGIDVLQCYGTADVGIIAYESMAVDGRLCDGMVLDEGIILELVLPGTGEPVAPGEVGEVVVTTLTPEYPLIRFATGDLSALLPGESPCGRTNHRIKGWLGRADQTTKVRGMFVHPEQIADLLRRHKSIIRARLVVERPGSTDEMTLLAEIGEPAEDPLRIAETLQAVTKLRGSVRLVAEGSLPADGKLIEDRRQLH